MEPYQYTNSSDDQGLMEPYSSFSGNYDFTQDSLANIPYPDDMDEDQNMADEVDLPPPPGAADDDPFPPFNFRNTPSSLNTPNKCSPFLLSDFDAADIPMPAQSENNSNRLSLRLSSSHEEKQENDENSFKITGSEGEVVGDFENDFKKVGDDNKYSPSKVESDEDNQDFINVKPKVLGKEQAKKRLMAFSLSKQPHAGVKKQNKIVTPLKTSKEKPPNPNKSSGVQEQFRATISAIEEEKKKMMQNMPNYLLLEMSELSKSTHPIIKSSLQLLDKSKNENSDSVGKDHSNKNDSVLNKSIDSSKGKDSSKKSRRRSRSGSRSRRSHSRSRQRRRSRSRSRRRSRSPSKSRRRSRSRSRTRKSRTDKNYKSDKNEESVSRKVLLVDWKSFKASEFGAETCSELSKQLSDEQSHKEEHSIRSPSPKLRGYFKPVFNYLKKGSRMMTYLKAKPADHGNSDPVLFPEKTIKYTRTKPIVIWSENPAHATEYYMPIQLLLENCDQATVGILQFIMENKNKIQLETDDRSEIISSKTREWYPRKEYLLPTAPIVSKELEANFPLGYKKLSIEPEEVHVSPLKIPEKDDDEGEDKKETKGKEESKFENKESTKQTKRERHISLVNDSYLSDEEAKVKEMVVGDVKVQLDLGLNCVKVRSKWDSDYEGDNSEKEAISRRDEDMDIATPDEQIEAPPLAKEKFTTENFTLEPMVSDHSNKKISKSPNSIQSQNLEASDPSTGNLVSEYEEFLKMVSFNSKESQETQNQSVFSDAPSAKMEKQKVIKTEKGEEENQKPEKFGTTDWDRESESEEKSPEKKVAFGKDGSNDDFSLLKEDKSEGKRKKNKKGVLSKKKAEKSKQKKNKLLKKSSKAKKKKYEDSSSSESSTDSYDSESDSDSVASKSEKKKKRKKKKTAKAKKKSKKDLSSDSDSDSKDSSKLRKKKSKKKKEKKKKKSENRDSEEEIQNVLLKQLDFKKQLIIKKIEEIDSISERSGKKKEKETRQKKEKENLEDSDLLGKYIKSGKKKKTEGKAEKGKKKSKTGSKKSSTKGKSKESRRDRSSSESDSESSENHGKKKKGKKEGKRKRETSESSSDKEKIVNSAKVDKLADIKNLKSLEKTDKKMKKMKNEQKKDYSSSDSDSVDSSPKVRKKTKKKKATMDKKDESRDEANKSSWKENFVLEKPGLKTGEKQFEWNDKKSWDRKSKSGKDGDDWEASSSVEESPKESKKRESNWDDEMAPKTEFSDEVTSKTELGKTDGEQSMQGKENAPEMVIEPVPETLKTSLSNFSFNENSFCSFEQELSRDFFLTDRSFSNSAGVGADGQNLKSSLVEFRPFQSVNKNKEVKKPAESERYSPGYSDSEVSDAEANITSERPISNSNAVIATKGEVYDPLDCDSEASAENNEIEVSSIPLPCVSEILLPGETRNFDVGAVPSPGAENKLQKIPDQVGTKAEENEGGILPGIATNTLTKISFITSDFTPVAASHSPFSDEKTTPTKKKIISVKAQQKLRSKAASVFQDDDSDEENPEALSKPKAADLVQSETAESLKRKVSENIEKTKTKSSEKEEKFEEKIKEERKRGKREDRCRSREKSGERERRRRRSGSRERRDSSKSGSLKTSSPSRRKRSKTPPLKSKDPEKREIRSDSFEIEPLKALTNSNELGQLVQSIPVLTSFGVPSSDRLWTRSQLPGYTCDFTSSGTLIDHPESFDIYPSEDSKSRNFDKDYTDEGSEEKPANEKLVLKDERSKKERRKSRSRSSSPRKRRRSKSPERRRSPRNRSPRRKSREKSPYSPRRRSPKRKSPSRRYRTSRSPDRRRKSRSRSPRKRRGSPLRRSRSVSPRKHRSPRGRRGDSLSRTFSPRASVSPRKDSRFSHPYASNVQNRIPVIGASCENADMEASPSRVRSPQFGAPMGFPPHIHPPSMNDSDINNSFYNNREYGDEFGATNYSEEGGGNNLITVKNHDMEKTNSPERLSLDQRIELELGVQLSSGPHAQGDQYPMPNQPFQDPNHFHNSYNCENGNASNDNFYQNQNMNPDFNGQYFNGHQQPPNYGPFQQYPNAPTQSSVMQVGNIVEVVPAMQHPPPPPPAHSSKAHQIMQVGNVLQVVPSPKVVPGASMPPPPAHNYGPPSNTSPLVKTQKATAVVAPSSIIPTPNPEAVINPLIKAIQLEREKRKKEKEKRKAEREARRKARQLRREAKLMSVNEKLKKSVQDEGLMLGQEVEDDELLDSSDLPSPPIPVEIITVSSQSTLPPAGKGILITAGFMPKPPSEKKEVKFADGVCPGEGTSSSGNEDVVSPPPKPKLPKEKRFKKKKTKVKKKVKVQIIRQIIQSEDDDDDDDLSPPPPPPGDPPPVFFARFPFAGDAQFPVFQTQTTTTTLTTVQYPAQSFQ